MASATPAPETFTLGGRSVEVRCVVALAIVLILGTLLLYNLGYYRLWDDEANTALFGEGVWRTGDTSAVIGHNIVAYGDGLELDGLHNRRLPPLPYYLEAPFVGVLGASAGAARLPFVLCGLLSTLLVLYWLWKDGSELRTWILVGLGACANVSLILYTRQARYYALATLLTLLIVFLYVHWDKTRRTLLALSASGLALLATHSIAYVALGLCLVVDYLLFGRHSRSFSWRQVAFVALSQGLIGGSILWVWNPVGKAFTEYVPANWLLDKLMLWWWYFRDLNACEFGAVLLLVAAPMLYFFTGRRNRGLVRLPFGVAVYTAAAAVASPEAIGWYGFADVRYIQAIIPGLIWLGVITLESLPGRDFWRYAGALLLFCTNVTNTGTARLIGVPTDTNTPPLLAGRPRFDTADIHP